jgi:hypothetical protein
MLIKVTTYRMIGVHEGNCKITSDGMQAYIPFLFNTNKYFEVYRKETKDYEAQPISKFTYYYWTKEKL